MQLEKGESPMKSIVKLFIACCLLFLMQADRVWPGEYSSPCTVMQLDRETLRTWEQSYRQTPAYVIGDLNVEIPEKGLFSLLNYLSYIPEERDQSYCGNCWIWAATGIVEIALNVQEGIFDRLSIQFINSCNLYVDGCYGGYLYDFTIFYKLKEYMVPWMNTNAGWDRMADYMHVSCNSIVRSPGYPVKFIEPRRIRTHNVGADKAIRNIKRALHQNRAVWFAFFMPESEDWDNFRDFWRNNSEEAVWNPDFSCEKEWRDGGGHAVLCVGYNDEDLENRYWIILNSWGTADGLRPNGIFRLDMDMDYDCYSIDWGDELKSFEWMTLDLEFENPPHPPEARAGEDQTTEEGSTVFLDAGNSWDADQDIVSFEWIQTKGENVTLSDSASAYATFVVPSISANLPGNSSELSFRLEIQDQAGFVRSDNMSIAVEDNGIDDFPEHVIPFRSATGLPLGISEKSDGKLVNLKPLAVEDGDRPDTDEIRFDFIYGLTEMHIKADQPGETVVLTVFFPEPIPENYKWYQHRSKNGWDDYTSRTILNTEQNQLLIILTDGDAGDKDGAVNGHVYHSAGLAIPESKTSEESSDPGADPEAETPSEDESTSDPEDTAASETQGNTSGEAGGAGDGGGCFIHACMK
jgi:hypothetical protein